MRSKDPELMKKICEFVDEYYRLYHESPTCVEIASKLGVATTTVYRYLVDMSERGMLSYKRGKIETLEMNKYKSGYFSAPIVDSIKSIDSEIKEENVEEYVLLPESIFGKGNFCILKNSDDSMIDADIKVGDIMLIQLNCQVSEGDVVIVQDDENQNTLKRYIGFEKESQRYLLKYENEEKYPGKIVKLKSLTIRGIVKVIFIRRP